MASCFSCFAASFNYHFHNFTFARSSQTVHHEHTGRLHSLKFPSSVSFVSHKARQQRKSHKKSATPSTRQGHSRAPSPSPSPSPHSASTASARLNRPHSPARSPLDDHLDDQPDPALIATRTNPIREPKRHVSFAGSARDRSPSELAILDVVRPSISLSCLSTSVKSPQIIR